MKNSSSTTNPKHPPILLAPNAFKGSLSAEEFCRIVADELQDGTHPLVSLPMCDGGDGTAATLAGYIGAAPHSIACADALGRRREATYYLHGGTALIDLAEVCGLKHLQPHEYDVLNANTAGLGQALLQLVQRGIRDIVLGVGGSASVDGGTGALVEMGLEIIKSGNTCRNHLIEMKSIDYGDLKQRFKDTRLTVLCDVNNPLLGTQGAARVFAPQKGAPPLQVERLEERLRHYAALLEELTSVSVATLPHGGAAGGIAAAFHALLGARLLSGADYCLELSGFHKLLPQACCVVTGEGSLDAQSLCGKLPGTIASLCRQHRKPLFAIAGTATLPLPGFTEVFTLTSHAPSPALSIAHPEPYLRAATRDLKKHLPDKTLSSS